MMAGIYRFLVSDFLNPLQLATGGAGSAEVYVFHKLTSPELLTEDC
jgi:hypothetical protein